MKVFLTRRAVRNFEGIREYITKEFGERTFELFKSKLDETFSLLEVFPEMGTIESKDIRGFQLSKQTRIFYRISGERIIVLSLFQVRQDPGKKPR